MAVRKAARGDPLNLNRIMPAKGWEPPVQQAGARPAAGLIGKADHDDQDGDDQDGDDQNGDQTAALPLSAAMTCDDNKGKTMTDARFTETLRQASEPDWSAATGHRFVRALYAGSLPDAVMANYLVQDHRFLDAFLTLLGAAIASADRFEARLRFGQFAGMVSGEENDYFLRSFAALGVDAALREQIPDSAPTRGFQALMREAAETRDYIAVLAVLNVAEWLYLDWASRAPQPLPGNFVHAEWITLHDNAFFRDFVAFLRAELDRVGPGHAALAQDFFGRAVALERAFFDAAYAGA